jgi:NADP-dependent 3-hydroxy acid dehydrogenase YdfG
MVEIESVRRRHPVLVSGAGSGMGRAVVRELTGAGYHLIALDRNQEALDDLQSELDDTGSCQPLAADVTVAASIESGLARILGPDGSLGGLIACAGTHDHASVASGDPERWAKMLEVNVMGVANCVKQCLPYLFRSDDADIIVWGSVSGFVAYTDESMYAASKAAVTHFLRCLRLELVDTAVRVCTIHPGIVDTPMTRAAGLSADELKFDFLQPEDVARCAAFVLSQPAHASINELVIRPARQPM